jgi:hypothetical protein
MKPQNCVVVKIDGQIGDGIVKQIYQLANHNSVEQELIVLSPITNLNPKKTKVPTA